MFVPMFSTPAATERTSGSAWLQAMLDFEAALAAAEAKAGLVPAAAAEEIARHCRVELFDVASIADRATSAATPVIALVRDLSALLDTDARLHVHCGATSQDVIDTAAMLVARDVLGPVIADLRAAADECARLAEDPGLVATLLSAMPQEYERAAGAWQSEWEPLTELLRLVAAAAARTRQLLAGLRVHPEKMTANLDLTRGLVMAESAVGPLLGALGRTEAQDLVSRLCRRAVQEGTTLRSELLADPQVRAVLSEAEVVAATESADYLGAAPAFVDRALAAHAELENR
ncbi:hypothetical protein FDZ84_34870 [Saccharopolyspora sp. ASAGF58]|nr:hypothetical protein FDZ84_34870 [Saccharopolyspora sp. ASAGF58]